MVFGRLIKWLVSASLLIGGFYCLLLASDEGNIQPVIGTIFGFGAVYILYRTADEIPKSIGFLTVLVFAAAAVAANFAPVPDGIPVLSENYYEAWWGWTMIIGLPVMTFGFIKFKS
jgi:hypothetical protein